jgi:hypothetical protein
MILNDDEIQQRIESPINLLNRLRKTSTPKNGSILPQSSGNIPVHIPTLPPKAEDIIGDLEDKIVNATARSKAMTIMVTAMNELQHRLPEVQKPETLSNIAQQMSKVIANHDANKPSTNNMSQIIVYAPQIQKLEDYEVIDIKE